MLGNDAYGPSRTGWEIDVRVIAEGRDELTTTEIHAPGGRLRIEEVLRWVYEYDAEASAVRYPIQDAEDLDLFIEHQPPAEPVDGSGIGRAKATVGENGIVAPWIQGAFNLVAYYYRRVDDLLIDAMLNPDLYNRMMRHFLARYKVFVGEVIDAGADVISYGGNIASGKMVGADFFREHILPYERDLIAFIQDRGVPVLYHNCGCAGSLMQVYPELEVKAYESLTPEPFGDTDLGNAVATLGGSAALAGGIDQVHLLRKGSEEEIRSAVREALETVGDRCPYILGTTDYFNEETPEESIRALADAGREFGAL